MPVNDIHESVGWMRVTAKGIVALADSDDEGHAPDTVPMIGTVTFTPNAPSPMVVLESREILSLATIVCGLGADGTLRPPQNGQQGDIDENGGLAIVAPDQSGLSHVGWTWTADFKPAPLQFWTGFKAVLTGAPGDVIDISEVILHQIAVGPGSVVPVVWLEESPEAKPGQFFYDTTTGRFYLIKEV